MPSSEAGERLGARLRRFERTATKLEREFRKGAFTRTDLEALYEGLFVAAIVEFEKFLERLFMDAVLGKSSYPPSRVATRLDVRSSQVLDSLIRGTRRYVDWLPYSDTEHRAKLYLRGGRPFTDLDSSERNTIDRWLWLRNAIAHASKHSQDVFADHVIAGIPLPPRERTPAGFLRSQIRPDVTRFANILAEMRAVAAKLCR